MSQGDLVRRMEELLADRVPFVTATVVRAAKPTSVRPGDAAIVLADGTIDGFVGGVCMPRGRSRRARPSCCASSQGRARMTSRRV